MKVSAAVFVTLSVVMVMGCATAESYKLALARLEETRKEAAQTASAFERFKKQSASEIEALQKANAGLRQERDILQTKTTDLQRQLDATQLELTSVKNTLTEANARIAGLEKEKGQQAEALKAVQQALAQEKARNSKRAKRPGR